MKSLRVPFGKLLKEYRATAGLSQQELATDSDLDRSYISMLETGVRGPTIDTLFKICKALGVAPSTMMKDFEKRIL